MVGLFLTYLIERARRLLKRTYREKNRSAAMIVSAVDANALVNDGAGGGETAQGNGGEALEHNQRNNLNIHIEASVDGMADYGVEFCLGKIAAIRNRERSETAAA